jgi:8-oxo-dGTP pyrophosphatase MutT (NUDIX family)
MTSSTEGSSSSTGFRRIGEQVVHAGYVWSTVVANFEDPTGAPFTRDIVRSPGAVGVVPLLFDAEGTPSVVLVDQYRAAFERTLLEIPAGMRDVVGEPTEETARRELIEEVGFTAERMELLTTYAPSVGMTDSTCTVYLATGLTSVSRDVHGPEEEHMTIVHLGLARAIEMIDRGEIIDSKTIIGLLLAHRHLHRADSGT